MDKITSPRRARGAPALQFAATLILLAVCLAGVFAAADALHRWTVETPIVDLRL
jgi:Flp pilus assembly protein TadG